MDGDISLMMIAEMTLMISRGTVDVTVRIQRLLMDVQKVITAMAIQRDVVRRAAVH